jgi:hypothetical protein
LGFFSTTPTAEKDGEILVKNPNTDAKVNSIPKLK